MQLRMTRDPLLGGIGFLGLAGMLLWFKLPYLTHGIREQGVVVDVEKRMARKGNTYYPVLAFYAGGRPVTFKSDIGSGSNPYRIGAVVPVLYLPDQAEQATLDTFSDLWLLPLLCGGAGLLGLLAALLGSIRPRAPSQRELYRQALYGWKPDRDVLPT